ncbi:MAG: Phytochrome-like protein cph1 [bacterium ADurb.Bin429]|nr:MAG: Phytochrome-like protein cph1 [bacterium ADurb.Bin429]
MDASGVITLVNSQLERLTGYQRDDILGKPVEMLIPERFRPVHVQHRAGYMTAPRTRPMGVGLDLYLRCKDGREVPVEISLSPFTTPEGLLVMASIRDITARKQAEEEITRLNTALRRNVEQLSVTNKELEAFSYSVSHDLRAPLRGIDGFSKILLAEYSGQLDETARDYLRRVRVAAQRMGRLIDDMLNLSRIGRREMQPAPVDVSALAAEVLAELRQAEPERAVTVIIAPEMTAVGDANLLRIVLENLLGNAWKFTGGRADARIEMGTLEEAGQTVYYIRDNGAGFDMAFADKLFTPFQRLHSEEEFSGTGIGLAIVQRIIARHGGRVWAEGAEGKGATFYFTVGEMVEEAA